MAREATRDKEIGDTTPPTAEPATEDRRKALCAAVLDALTDSEVRAMVVQIVTPAIAAATVGHANIYDLKPDAFRRPLPGIHIL